MQSDLEVLLLECSDDMSVEKELARLAKEIYGNENVKGIRERLGILEVEFRQTSRWVKIAASIILTCLAGLAVEMYHVNGRLSTIEGEVKALPARTAQQLLQQSQQAAATGKTSEALRAAEAAAVFLNQARTKHASIEQAFFEQVTQQLQSLQSVPQLSQEVHNARLALASYRSAINSPPPLPRRTANLTPNLYEKGLALSIAAYPVSTTFNLSPPKPFTLEGNGAAFDARGMRIGQEIIIPATRSLDENPIVIKDLVLIGATQTLDYITWDDVTFIDAHIKYQGGPVRLRHVRFVNCTFDFPSNDVGARVAEYAALEPKQELRVG
jgi:hypothetical protein